VIEMNPRVSRSSALASKATGFPIAKVAAKLAVGYTLDELRNDITKHTPASFEPSIDYVVVKIPRFDFAKFPQTDRTLTTMMKSVGEVMAIGRTFKEAFLKAIRSLEIDTYGLLHPSFDHVSDDVLVRNLRIPNPERIWYIASAFRRGYSVDEVYHYTRVDRWFLYQIKQIVDFESTLAQGVLDEEKLRQAKELGYSDFEIAKLVGKREEEVKALRESMGVFPSFKGVDTCAGEFVAYTPYYYSTYEKPYYTIDGQEILDED
jgi:carbamoyl-phosphate synthase large subunit